MKQYTVKEFTVILNNNGFRLNRISGSHYIFTNNNGNHISIPYRKLNSCIAKRLIKENNLLL